MLSERNMVLEAMLKLTYESEEAAQSVLGAVELDNKGYVDAEKDGRTLLFRCSSGDVGSLRNTLDDLLSCIGIAERMMELKRTTAEADGINKMKKTVRSGMDRAAKKD